MDTPRADHRVKITSREREEWYSQQRERPRRRLHEQATAQPSNRHEPTPEPRRTQHRVIRHGDPILITDNGGQRSTASHEAR